MSDPRAGRDRGDGATGRLSPAGFPVDPPGPVRPPRPVGVELAAALMITTGAWSTFATVEAISILAQRGEQDIGLAVLSLVLGVGTIVLGVLVRTGRAWILAVNVAVVAGFLELSSVTNQGILFGVIDVVVVLILVRERPWFAWKPDRPGDAVEERDEG